MRVQTQKSGTSWLCPNPGDRDRLLDMEQRLDGVRRTAFGVLTATILVAAPWMGWWLIAPVVACAVAFGLADRGLENSARPEYRIAFVWVCSQLTIAACASLTGGAHSPGLSWLVVPIITLPVRFGTRGVAAGVGVTIAMLLAVTLGFDFQSTINGPEQFLFPLAAIVAVALMSTALLNSDLDVRSRDFTFLPPIASCNLDEGLVLSGKYQVDVGGPGGALPQPTSCDFGDFHALVLFDAARDSACPAPLVANPNGAGCVRGIPEGGPVSLVFPSPVTYTEVRVVLEATPTGTVDAFLASASTGIDVDHVYVDGVSVTTSTAPGDPRSHAFTFAAGPCPCAPANGTPAPGFVGSHFMCDDDATLFDFNALDSQCHQVTTPNTADVTVAPSTGPVEVRVMTDEAVTDEDIAITKLQVFVR